MSELHIVDSLKYAENKKSVEPYWQRLFNDFEPLLITTELINDIETQKLLFKKYVELINIETSSYCNRACVYCPDSSFDRNFKKQMKPTLLDRILQDLSTINFEGDFSLNLYNEPLAEFDSLISVIKKIKSNLPNSTIGFNSNGDFLDSVKLEKLSISGVNRVKITIHPPKSKNWDEQREYKRLNEFVRNLGLNLENNISESPIYLQYEKLFLVIQTVDFTTSGNYRAGTANQVLNLTNRVQPCVKPFREFTIYFDGAVTQCCDAFYNPNYIQNKLSDVNTSNVFEIYSSTLMRKIRSELFQWGTKKGICKNCTSLDLAKQSDEAIRKKLIIS